MIHSSLTAVRCLDNGYVGKQPVAWKEYCAEYWLKERQESMDRCNGLYNITETLKTASHSIQSVNQSRIQTDLSKKLPTFKGLSNGPLGAHNAKKMFAVTAVLFTHV